MVQRACRATVLNERYFPISHSILPVPMMNHRLLVCIMFSLVRLRATSASNSMSLLSFSCPLRPLGSGHANTQRFALLPPLCRLKKPLQLSAGRKCNCVDTAQTHTTHTRFYLNICAVTAIIKLHRFIRNALLIQSLHVGDGERGGGREEGTGGGKKGGGRGQLGIRNACRSAYKPDVLRPNA